MTSILQSPLHVTGKQDWSKPLKSLELDDRQHTLLLFLPFFKENMLSWRIKRFFPTDVGKLVSGFLTNHFADYVDYEFTAQLEDELDAISRGEAKWIKVLGEFWGDFEKTVKNKETVSRGEVQRERHIGTHQKMESLFPLGWDDTGLM